MNSLRRINPVNPTYPVNRVHSISHACGSSAYYPKGRGPFSTIKFRQSFPMPSQLERRWRGLNSRIEACTQCERLVAHCRSIAAKKKAAYRDWDYWGKPVPNLGGPAGRLLIVGLAPGRMDRTARGGCLRGTTRATGSTGRCTRRGSPISRTPATRPTGWSCSIARSRPWGTALRRTTSRRARSWRLAGAF